VSEVREKRGTMRKLKLYLETSVWSFFYAEDVPESMDITRRFFDSLPEGSYEIFLSEVVLRELGNAPEPRKTYFAELVEKFSPMKLEITDEIQQLATLYMERGIVPASKRDDALHVGIAAYYEMDAIITWNYHHLVNLRKSGLFNGVNLESGYTKRLEIATPMEVSSYES